MAEIEDRVAEAHEQYRQAKLDVFRRNFRSTLSQVAEVLDSQSKNYKMCAEITAGQRSSSDLRQALKNAENYRAAELRVLQDQIQLILLDMATIEKDAP